MMPWGRLLAKAGLVSGMAATWTYLWYDTGWLSRARLGDLASSVVMVAWVVLLPASVGSFGENRKILAAALGVVFMFAAIFTMSVVIWNDGI